MANVQINQVDDATQSLDDTDVVLIEQNTGSAWVTGKITLLALYTWLVSALVSAGRLIGGSSKVQLGASGSLALDADSTPTTPGAGSVALVASSLGGLSWPSWVTSDGQQWLVGAGLGATRNVVTSCFVGSATPTNFGITSSTEGTGSAFTPGGSDLPDSLVKINFTSSASAGSSASLRYAAAYLCRGAAAGAGGFMSRWIWHANDAASVAQARCFAGLAGTTGALGNVDPSTLTNIVGIGADSGETNLSIMHNDGSGTATKVALGTSYPAHDTSAVYELILYAPPSASAVEYRVRNLSTGAKVSGQITTDLPAGSQMLTHHCWRNNGSTALSVRLAFSYYESWRQA